MIGNHPHSSGEETTTPSTTSTTSIQRPAPGPAAHETTTAYQDTARPGSRTAATRLDTSEPRTTITTTLWTYIANDNGQDHASPIEDQQLIRLQGRQDDGTPSEDQHPTGQDQQAHQATNRTRLLPLRFPRPPVRPHR